MSALAEALLAAQRQAIATLEKQYVAGTMEVQPFCEWLDAMGCRDVRPRRIHRGVMDETRGEREELAALEAEVEDLRREQEAEERFYEQVRPVSERES